MGRLNLRERIRPRNWSVRQTLVILTLAYLLGALLLSSLAVSVGEEGQSRLYEPYYQDYEIAEGLHTKIIVGDVAPVDSGLARFLGVLTIAAPLVIFAAAILLEAFTFYRLKLKRPIAILQGSALRISQNDLDFTVEIPSGDEMGQLCAAFETMRAQLEQNNRDLWRTMEERKRLNAAFAHDLRTPITVLKGYAGLLTAYLPTGKLPQEKVLSTVSCMSDSISRLESYVGTMNTLQKLEDTPASPSRVSSPPLAAKLQASLEVLAREAGREFTFSAEGLPEEIRLDESLFFRVFENIAANAFRYAAHTVCAKLSAEGDFLCLSVSDDGRGFSPEELRMATNPFYRDRESAGPHLGLGLNISQTLCQKHGGSLSLSHSPSGGARVEARFSLSVL